MREASLAALFIGFLFGFIALIVEAVGHMHPDPSFTTEPVLLATRMFAGIAFFLVLTSIALKPREARHEP